MIRYLTLDEVLDLHRWALQAHGGGEGILNIGMVESALFSPQASFAGVEAHPKLFEKAAALGLALVKNHAFVDGNKRVGFAAMATFLRLNGFGLKCEQTAGADVIIRVAAGEMTREQLGEWIAQHSDPLAADGAGSKAEE